MVEYSKTNLKLTDTQLKRLKTAVKKKNGSGTTTLKISNKKINDLLTIVEALEYFSILLKEDTKKIKNQIKE